MYCLFQHYVKIVYLLLVRWGGVGPIHLEINGRRFFYLVPRLLGQSMELVQAKHMVEAEALLFAPGTTTTSYFVFWIVQSQPIATTCVNVAIMMTITLLQWAQCTSAPLQRSVSRQSPSTCHTSQVSPPDSGNAFVLFPHCLNLIGKKIPEELCLSPPTALAHQSQSLSEDKIDLKFHVCNCAINRLHD